MLGDFSLSYDPVTAAETLHRSLGASQGGLSSHAAAVKRPVTPGRKHVDSSGVLVIVKRAGVKPVFPSSHRPKLHNKPRFLWVSSQPSPCRYERDASWTNSLDAAARPITKDIKFTRRLITRDSRLQPQCTEHGQVKASSVSHDIREC